MDEATSKGISLPITALLIVLVCTFGLILYNKTKPMQKTADNNLNVINQSMTSTSFGLYDNTVVSGSSVISAINTKASSEVVIHVKTNKSSVDYTSASYNVTDINDTDYIEETANFRATLDKNENGSTVGINFEQQ